MENCEENCASSAGAAFCDCADENITCSSVVNQCEDVSVAVKLSAYTHICGLATQCCGEPKITVKTCKTSVGTIIRELIITQSVCTRIPIEYCVAATQSSPTITPKPCKPSNSCER